MTVLSCLFSALWLVRRLRHVPSSPNQSPSSRRLAGQPAHNTYLLCTEYIFCCKRAILFLSSSRYWPPIPLSALRVCSPRLCCGGRTDSPGGDGEGGSIFWKTREIGFPSYSKICTLWYYVSKSIVCFSHLVWVSKECVHRCELFFNWFYVF